MKDAVAANRLAGGSEDLTALACGAAPQRQARWSLRLLAERFVVLGHVEALSHETVRRPLKKAPCARR